MILSEQMLNRFFVAIDIETSPNRAGVFIARDPIMSDLLASSMTSVLLIGFNDDLAIAAVTINAYNLYKVTRVYQANLKYSLVKLLTFPFKSDIKGTFPLQAPLQTSLKRDHPHNNFLDISLLALSSNSAFC